MTTNTFASPYIIKSDGQTQPLSRIAMDNKGAAYRYDEAWLQDQLFHHPDSLPVREIDSGYQRLVPICRELNTPAGPLDVLYATPDGKLVLLEAKLWRNPQARREVIGQILDYAKELNRWDYEELQKQVSKRLGKPGNQIFELVRGAYPDTQEADFVDGISRSLRHGQFMLLIVGDGIREGAGAIAQFLENVGYLQFSLGLVEVGLFGMPNGEILVQPRILAKTVIINRSVIELASTEIKVADELVESAEQDTYYADFWKEFVSRLKLDDVSQPLPNPAKAQSQFVVIPPGTSHCWINAYFASSVGEVGVYFRLKKTEFGELAYQQLAAEGDSLLAELPGGARWSETSDHRTVSSVLPVNNIRDPAEQEKVMMFFLATVNAYVNVFRGRMEEISVEMKT